MCFLVHIFTAAADNVDFSGVTTIAVGIINKLDHTQRGVANTESTIAQLERSLKTAKAGTTISGNVCVRFFEITCNEATACLLFVSIIFR